MSGLFARGQNTSNTAERLGTVQIQTSSYGKALPLVYGTTRVAGNLVYYEQRDFTAIPHTTSQNVGKGGGGSTMSDTTYTYTCPVIIAICSGPINGITKVWRDKDRGTLAGYGFTLYVGDHSQAPWTWATSNRPDRAVAYAGTAYVAHSAADLGNSATLKNHSFEVVGIHAIPSGYGEKDANPADVVTHFLTDSYEGAGWAASRLGSVSSFRTYCIAAGFWFSPALQEQKPALDHLKEFLEATNSEAVWSDNGSGGMALKILPYGDQPITANGTTYTPNTTPIYDMDEDDFLVDGTEDPIRVEIRSLGDSYNVLPVEFLNRAIDYNTDVAEDPYQVDVDTYGERRGQTSSLHCIARGAHALQISGIKAQRSVLCRQRYTFRLGWKYILLEPMDLVTLTDSILGLDQKVVRILSIEEDDDGALEVTAEEWPFGVATATLYGSGEAGGDGLDTDADPGDALEPVVIPVPAMKLLGANQEIWIGTAGAAGSMWGGCEVWISYDDATYAWAGQIVNPARFGSLNSTLPDGAEYDTTNTLAVTLQGNGGQLQSVGADAAEDLLSLCWVDGELVSYETAALVGTATYNLTNLHRGANGTTISSHSSGANKFARVDESLVRFEIPFNRTGTIYIKLVSFNIWGGGLQDISSLVPWTYDLTGTDTTYPQPSNVTFTITDARPD